MKSQKTQKKSNSEWQVGVCSYCKCPIHSTQEWILLEPPLKMEWSPNKYRFIVHRNTPCLDKILDFIWGEMDEKIEGYNFLCQK